MVDASMLSVQPVVNDPGLPALDKLRALFAGIASWKTAHKELLLAVMSDDNALVREKFRWRVVERLTPVMAAIIRQGQTEAVFTVTSPVEAARVLVSFNVSLNQSTTELFLARQANTISLDEVRRVMDAQAAALERILGAPSESLSLVDDSVLQEWFG